ncbi:50S ribosomal protein L31 [Pseudonocardia sp. DSM 45834]|uniref:50S ribosomal protein L31 n=1 Tax=Pseudonocardia charpentierae TaxID=3075545 RepID=A0ABU2NJX7_9PSEU|nr:50S ribosomal protein L31 [Pseudonocardia sp. DSM 45834]MDT0353892.1 50S ribosomal protein L31 [Pseudonocardia sp. DSM 45834]
MKAGIHPDNHPVVFQDRTTGDAFLSRSTARSEGPAQRDRAGSRFHPRQWSSRSHPYRARDSHFRLSEATHRVRTISAA